MKIVNFDDTVKYDDLTTVRLDSIQPKIRKSKMKPILGYKDKALKRLNNSELRNIGNKKSQKKAQLIGNYIYKLNNFINDDNNSDKNLNNEVLVSVTLILEILKHRNIPKFDYIQYLINNNINLENIEKALSVTSKIRLEINKLNYKKHKD